MTAALRGVGSVQTIPTNGSSVTLPVTTNLNDVIVVTTALAGVDANLLTFTGAGATWPGPTITNTAPGSELYVGYGCTAGNTTITLHGTVANGSTESLVVSVWSGLITGNPIDATFAGLLSANGASTSQGPISCTNGDLIIANYAVFAPSSYTGSPSWSAGFANTFLVSNVTAATRDIYSSYCLATAGGSTSYTTVANSANAQYAVTMVSLKTPPAPPVSTTRLNTSVAAIRASQR